MREEKGREKGGEKGEREKRMEKGKEERGGDNDLCKDGRSQCKQQRTLVKPNNHEL